MSTSGKVLDGSGLAHLWGRAAAAFSPVGHTHELADITDYAVDMAIDTHSLNPVANTVIEAALSNKSNTGHTHNASDIAYGTLSVAHGGTGQSGSTLVDITDDITGLSSKLTIVSARMRMWGKVCQFQMQCTVKTAISSNEIINPVCTIPAGYRPALGSTPANSIYMGFGQVTADGVVQIRMLGALSVGQNFWCGATYVMA